MNNLTPEQLSFRAGYEQGRFDAQADEAQYVVTSDTSQELVDEMAKQRHEQQQREWVGFDEQEFIYWCHYCEPEYLFQIINALKEKNT